MSDAPIDITSRLPKRPQKPLPDAYAGHVERMTALQEYVRKALMDMSDLREELTKAADVCSNDDFWKLVLPLKEAVRASEVLLGCAVDKLREGRRAAESFRNAN